MTAIKYISTPSPSTSPLEFTIKGGPSAMRLAIGPGKLNLSLVNKSTGLIDGPFSDMKDHVHSTFCNVGGVSCKIDFFIVVLGVQ